MVALNTKIQKYGMPKMLKASLSYPNMHISAPKSPDKNGNDESMDIN